MSSDVDIKILERRERGRKIGSANKGRKHSEETKKKISDSLKGGTMPFRGKPWSDKRREAQKHVVRSDGLFMKKSVKKAIMKHGKEYHPNWIKIRESIYERDNWTCLECGVKCHNVSSKRIQCHHIDYDQTNNSSHNLITLCASCHAKTNYNRPNWIRNFQRKVKFLWQL